MNQPTNEQIWTWVKEHPEFERAKHVCPQCHVNRAGDPKVHAPGEPILEPPMWIRCTACGYEFGEREAAMTEVVRIETHKRFGHLPPG